MNILLLESSKRWSLGMKSSYQPAFMVFEKFIYYTTLWSNSSTQGYSTTAHWKRIYVWWGIGCSAIQFKRSSLLQWPCGTNLLCNTRYKRWMNCYKGHTSSHAHQRIPRSENSNTYNNARQSRTQWCLVCLCQCDITASHRTKPLSHSNITLDRKAAAVLDQDRCTI